MAKTFYELENEVKELEIKVEKLICELTKTKRKLEDIEDETEYFINEINSKLKPQKEDKVIKPSFVGVIINRILSFIPFLLVALVGSFILFSKWMINFVRYGGESIAYTEKTTRKTIHDVFVKLEEKQNNER